MAQITAPVPLPPIDPLAEFRAREAPRDAASLVWDRLLRRLLSVWPSVPLDWEPPAPGDLPDGPPRVRWEALWEGFEVPIVDLADLMGVSVDLAARAYTLARAQRLIYPDGTVHGKAGIILDALAVKDLPKPKGSGR